MRRNRIILFASIIGTGVYASFVGGNIPKALFYFTLIIPVIAYLYTLYVFLRFKLYQKIESRKVMKGEFVPYEFTLANEDIIGYTGIRVNFFSDSSYVSDAGRDTDYLLLPGDSNTMSTTLCCRYRGEYDVGAKAVVITDFLYLFSVTYPITTKLNLIVLPRIHKLNKAGKSELDTKSTKFCFNPNSDLLDSEVRNYSQGDSVKHIHWKSTARRQELMVRKMTEISKTSISIIMDLSPVKENHLQKIIIEDKIVESAISLANYYKDIKTSVFISYDYAGISKDKIENHRDFEAFYDDCVRICFNAKESADSIIMKDLRLSESAEVVFVITHLLTKELLDSARLLFSRDKEMTIIFVSDSTDDNTTAIIQEFMNAGIYVKQIFLESEISDILNV